MENNKGGSNPIGNLYIDDGPAQGSVVNLGGNGTWLGNNVLVYATRRCDCRSDGPRPDYRRHAQSDAANNATQTFTVFKTPNYFGQSAAPVDLKITSLVIDNPTYSTSGAAVIYTTANNYITKAGDGVLELTNPNNSFTAGSAKPNIISEGAIIAGANGALGGTSANTAYYTINLSGALGFDGSGGMASYSPNLTVTVNSYGDLTPFGYIPALFTNAGTVGYSGPVTLTTPVTQANSYIPVYVGHLGAGDILTLGQNFNLGTAGQMIVYGPGVTNLTGSITGASSSLISMVGSGTLNLSNAANTSFVGTLAVTNGTVVGSAVGSLGGAGDFINVTTGVTSSPTSSGTTAGTLFLSLNSTAPSSWTVANPINVNGATLVMSPAMTYAGPVTLSNNSLLTVQSLPSPLTSDNAVSFAALTVFNDNITSSTSNAPGDLTVSGMLTIGDYGTLNTYGNVFLPGGIAGYDTATNGPGTLDLTASTGIATVGNVVALGSQVLDINGLGSAVFNAPMTSTASNAGLVKNSTTSTPSSPATLTLNCQSPNFLGSVMLNAGETIVTANSALGGVGDGATATSNGAALVFASARRRHAEL